MPMATLKNNWLRAITLGLFMMGLIFTSQAGEIDPPKKDKKAATGVAIKETAPTKMLNQTWHYNGGPTDSPTDASKYSLSSGEPCGILQETVCKLNAPASTANPNQPDMNAEVEVDGEPEPRTITQRINDAFSGSTPQANETVQSFKGL